MPDLPIILWLVLAGLAYMLVTCVLGTLASRIGNEIERHNLVAEARRRYMERKSRKNPDKAVAVEAGATAPLAQVGQQDRRAAA